MKAPNVAASALAATIAALVAVAAGSGAGSAQSAGAPAPRLIGASARLPAPDFSRPLVDGNGSAGPSAFAGRVVVIDFWSSWCAPCRSELHQLALASKADRSAAFLGVDVDDSPRPARDVLLRSGVRYPNVMDPDSRVADSFDVAGTPTIVVLDRTGRIAVTAIGPTAAAVLLRLVAKVDRPASGHGG